MNNQTSYEAIIIGAGAAGLFAAAELGKRKIHTCLIEQNTKPGKKIIISGGGRCNFTNLNVTFDDFKSNNPHFFKSALTQYTQEDFIQLVKKHGIPFYEKKLGQLFCKGSSKEVLNMLLKEIDPCFVTQTYGHQICQNDISIKEKSFIIKNSTLNVESNKLIIATGGPPMPAIGGTDTGVSIAKKFGHKCIPFVPALVPLRFNNTEELSGLSLPVEIKFKNQRIKDDILFTHRGLSGPAILKLTLWANHGDTFHINWDPKNKFDLSMKPKGNLQSIFKKNYPKNWIDYFFKKNLITNQPLPISKEKINKTLFALQNDTFKYISNEGFKKAEVAKGGVDTADINSKTMESKKVQGLYFIGETIDVTGLLGGYNFQWAWSSAFACANALKPL